MADLKPILPQGFDAAITINANDPRYHAVQAVAQESGMTQEQFSNVLAMETRRAMEHSGVAPGKVVGYDNMSFAQKMFAAEVMQKAKRR
jgi:hypothetical protein